MLLALLCPYRNQLKILGITLDSHLTFSTHIQSLTKNCYFHIRALRHIRSSITVETAKSLAHAIVSSRLDYGNSLFMGISDLNMRRLQRVQTTLAQVVLASPHSRKTSAESLRQLHWLPFQHRISFKIAMLTYKIFKFRRTRLPQKPFLLLCPCPHFAFPWILVSWLNLGFPLQLDPEHFDLLHPNYGISCLLMYVLLPLQPLSDLD